jgi:hypothetical protein
VKLCKSKTTGIHLALKMLRKSEIMRTQQAVHVCAERSILQELDHPYIVRLCAPRALTSLALSALLTLSPTPSIAAGTSTEAEIRGRKAKEIQPPRVLL